VVFFVKDIYLHKNNSNMRIHIALLALSIALSSHAQPKAKHYARNIRDCSLKAHLCYLASDSLKGRDTGAQGQKLAAQYIAKHFQKNNLQAIVPQPDSSHSYYQKYDLQRVKLFGGGYRYLSISPKNRNIADTVHTENVLGYIEGTDLKDQVIVLTAHYDHIGITNGQINNGADDDGSGTVAILELAQAFAQAKKDGHGPRRSILFMTVTGEEKGLLGSKYFVENPIIPLPNIVCNLNIDMIGRTDNEHRGKPDYIYLIGSDKLSSQLHAISETTNAEHTKLDLDYTYNHPEHPERFYYRSDHYNFAEKKIPVIFYFRGVHDDYHQPTDDVQKIQFDQLEKVTKLVFYTAWELANRTDRIVVDSNKP
jgi:hypothetical protein